MTGVRFPLVLVVAMGPGRIIGRDGGLPWHLPEDLRHFKQLTLGHAIIMGRRTWDSIGRPLPQRRSIVVTGQSGLALAGAETAGSIEEAVARARETDPEPRVIGGSSIYEAALPLATRIHLTEVELEVEGDTFFPELPADEWKETSRVPAETEGVTFVTLERRA